MWWVSRLGSARRIKQALGFDLAPCLLLPQVSRGGPGKEWREGEGGLVPIKLFIYVPVQ